MIGITALNDCPNPANNNDIPCMIVSSWNYTDCNESLAYIYNTTPTLIGIYNFSGYGQTGRCNITWNITTLGSYVWTVQPDLDSGRIDVEVDETMNLAVVLGLSIFALLFIILGIYLIYKRRENV